MKIQALRPEFQMPVRSSTGAGGLDIFMPEAGVLHGHDSAMIGLGFAAEVPMGHVALLLPRSGSGSKGLELMNTCGVIDSDYRGEWKAKLRSKTGQGFSWEAGDRLIQFIVVPVWTPVLELVDSVEKSVRGAGGFGSTGA